MPTELPDGWRSGRVSDLVVEVTSRIDPQSIADPETRSLGLEDIGQGTGTVVSVGRAGDVTSQKTCFSAGDVLFGKLRPNLKKVARPSFEGICSTDISVFRAKSRVDPDFAFRVLASDPVIEHAVAHSAGTKMPRAHARSILAFETLLPPLDEQRRIAEVLRSVDECIRAAMQAASAAKSARMALLASLFHRGDWEPERALPSGWKAPLLDTVAKRGSGHTPNKQSATYWNGDVKWISLQDTKRLDRVYITDTAATITPEGLANSSAVLHPANTVVVSRDATVGRSAIMVSSMAVSQHFITYTCGPELSPIYLYYWLQRMKPVFERIGAGSTIKTIGLPFFKGLRIAAPDRAEQDRTADLLWQADSQIFAAEAAIGRLRSVKAAVSADLLLGRVRVPA